jgi:hypothetical protein
MLRIDRRNHAETVRETLDYSAVRLFAMLDHLTAQQFDVAFETTLASRSFAPWIRELGRS